MSRAYQIRVSTSLTHHSRVEDGIEARLELLPILAPERTAELLAGALAERGYTVEDGVGRKEVDGVTVTVDTTTGTVTLSIAAEEEVALETTRVTRSYEERASADRERLLALAQTDLAGQAAEHDEAARERISATLEQVLADLTPELGALTDDVNRAALKERAAQLGQILDVTENAESGELTIRVKV